MKAGLSRDFLKEHLPVAFSSDGLRVTGFLIWQTVSPRVNVTWEPGRSFMVFSDFVTELSSIIQFVQLVTSESSGQDRFRRGQLDSISWWRVGMVPPWKSMWHRSHCCGNSWEKPSASLHIIKLAVLATILYHTVAKSLDWQHFLLN